MSEYIKSEEINESTEAAQLETNLPMLAGSPEGEPVPGEYRLKEPFQYEDRVYERFVFNFASLTGKDLMEVEKELTADNDFFLSALSINYSCRLAAKAAGVDSSVILALPLKETVAIKQMTRDFLGD